MKVSKAIEMLSKLNPDEEICISWWESNLFFTNDENETPVSPYSQEWISAVSTFDAEGGYGFINRQMWELINYSITGEGEF